MIIIIKEWYSTVFPPTLKIGILAHNIIHTKSPKVLGKIPRFLVDHSAWKYIWNISLQEEYSQRRRLSTPSGSPSPPRPTRLSRSTGTLTRDEESFRESSNTLTRENQGQEAERKGWFKSLSRKNKSNIKVSTKLDKRIELLLMGPYRYG